MNDGSVTVKLDGKKLEEIGEAMRAATSEAVTELVKAGPAAVAPEAPQGDGLKTPRAVGADEASPKQPAKVIGEPGVRRTTKYLPCKLTDAETNDLHREISRVVADVDAAEGDVERIKERAKADVQTATNRAKELRLQLADKARTTREGKVHRDVACTVRIDWHARTKTTTRDDTGEVLDVEPASPLEVADCGTWETDLKAGKSYLKAPDGAVLDQRNLTDAERQTSLPLADGGKAPAEPAKAERAWLPLAAWQDIDDDTTERFIKPDPHGKAPAIEWTSQGTWITATIPAGLRSPLDHHAKQAGVAFFYGETAPTLADLAAASTEKATPKRKPRGAKS